MLNLRRETTSSPAQSTFQISTVRFNANMFMGNMGQTLRFGPEDDEVDDDDDHTNQEPTNDAEYSRTTSIDSVRVSAFLNDELSESRCG